MPKNNNETRIYTPISILPGWNEGEDKAEPYEQNRSNFERIDGDVKHDTTEVEYRLVDDPVGPYVKRHHETDLVAISHAREAYRADQSGEFDAIRLPCFDEPGLGAAREVSDTLVMSTPCAALHVASMLGNDIGIVISGSVRGDVTLLRNIIKQYDFEDRVVTIRTTGLDPTEMHPNVVSEEKERKLEQAAVTEATAAVEEDGADVLIAYSGSHEILSEELDVPVIKPEAAALKMTEALAEMGLSHSKRAYPTPETVHDYYIRPKERGPDEDA